MLSAALLCLVLAVPQSSRAPSVDELVRKIEALEARVQALEAAAGTTSDSAETTATVPVAPPADRVMRVLRIDPVLPDLVEGRKVLERLEQKRIDLDRELKMKGDALADRRVATELRKQAKALDDQIAAQRKALDTPLARVVGWNGVQFVALVTELPAVDDVQKIKPGAFIQWKGTRTAFDAALEVWSITACGLTKELAGYSDLSKGRALPTFTSSAAEPK